MNKTKDNTEKIKAEAKRLGFFACGISKARFLDEDKEVIKKWLSNNNNGTMSYMERNLEKRLNPKLLVENARSIISVLLPYYPHVKQKETQAPIISKYAYGEDYHFIVKEKLKKLYTFINENIQKINGRIFTDSAPVLEKKWAELSGLGWIGKNTLLINKKGSYFFIGEIISDIDLEYDSSSKNYCGTCTRCIDACPTNAITEPYVLDSTKCISYLTIENKEKLPENLKHKFKNRVFGCDICQDVCPHNRKPILHNEPRFMPHNKILDMNNNEWQNLTKEEFNEIFKNSPVKRAKYSGFKRNLDFIK